MARLSARKLHLAANDPAQTLCQDGLLAQIVPRMGSDFSHSAPLRQRQELPDPRLRGLNIAEITLSGSAKEQSDILDQAVQYGDILLWCSRAFAPEEQALWAAVPDTAKDHAFLVLSMADQLIMRGTLPPLMEALSPLAAEEFLGLYPLAAIQGLNAQQGRTRDTSGLDRELWHKSGGKRLYDDLMQHVDRGRTADLDLAEALVQQFGDPGEAAPPVPPVPPASAQTQSATVAAAPSQDDLLAAAAQKIKERAAAFLPKDDQSDGDLDQVLQGALDCVRQLGQDLSGLDDRPPQGPRRPRSRAGRRRSPDALPDRTGRRGCHRRNYPAVAIEKRGSPPPETDPTADSPPHQRKLQMFADPLSAQTSSTPATQVTAGPPSGPPTGYPPSGHATSLRAADRPSNLSAGLAPLENVAKQIAEL